MPGEANPRQVFIGNVKLIKEDVILEEEERGDHPNEIVSILDHEPKTQRKANKLSYEILVKYAQITEPRWIKAVSIRTSEVFKEYAKNNGLEHLLST